MPSAHAKLSPSGADRWVECPGSIHAEPAAKDTGSKSADEGTAQHEVLSRCLVLGKSPRFFVGEQIKGIRITKAMTEAVAEVVAWVKAYLKAHPGAILYSEKEVDIGPAFGLPITSDGKTDLWGTSDVIIHAGRELVIADAKFGYHPVAAWMNRQLTLYAVGEEHQNGMLGFEHVRLAILQPAQGNSEFDFPVADLHEYREGLLPAVKAALDPLAPRRPSEKACKWCRAAPICPALREKSLLDAQAEFGRFDTLSVEQVKEVLDRAEVTEAYIASVRRHALGLVQSGLRIEGYKVVQGATRRAWADEEQACKALVKAGVPEDEAAPRKVVSPAKAEKLLGKPKAKAVLEGLVFQPPGEPRLVAEADGREALPAVFEVLD